MEEEWFHLESVPSLSSAAAAAGEREFEVVASRHFASGELISLMEGEEISTAQFGQLRRSGGGDKVILLHGRLYDASACEFGAQYINCSAGQAAGHNARLCNPPGGEAYSSIRAKAAIAPGDKIRMGYGSSYWDLQPGQLSS